MKTKEQRQQKRPNEKKCALMAWQNATSREKLTPLLKALGAAIKRAKYCAGTFKYAHDLGGFSRRIAQSKEHSHWACLKYQANVKGEWTVTNHDLNVYSSFEMWFDRFRPDSHRCETGRIAEAMKIKRMQQALDRYQKTGLREEHCLMVQKLLWEVDTGRGDWISIFAQGKRPFGDSSRAWSIYQACGWKIGKGNGAPSEERAWNIFDELPFALPDIGLRASKTFITVDKK